jgi:TRAP-type C4-dicarboxylate transport system substrate-binding protein
VRRCAAAVLLATIAALGPAAADEPTILRVATVAPDGTAWAREMRAASREFDSRTEGRVKSKWYWGGVVGNELEMGERLRRGQIDEVVSGGPLCTEVMPTLRILRVPGLFQGRDEAQHVMNKLQSRLVAEARERGLVELSVVPIGGDMFFLNHAVSSLAELRSIKLWQWDLDSAGGAMARAMGFQIVPTSIEGAARAFDDGKLEGFWVMPTAAMAFQLAVRAPYLLDLNWSILFGCTLLSSRFFYGLSPDDQKALVTVIAHGAERIADVGLQQETALLSGAFKHQGVKLVPASERFRAEFFAAAKSSQEHDGPKLVPRELIQQVKEILADYRAEHAGRAPR